MTLADLEWLGARLGDVPGEDWPRLQRIKDALDYAAEAGRCDW